MPLPAARFPETTLEPDFLVIYRGRVLALEVDGPAHHTRKRQDIGREHVLLGAGITCLRRIDVRDTNDDQSLDEKLSLFLRHLAGGPATAA